MPMLVPANYCEVSIQDDRCVLKISVWEFWKENTHYTR